MKRKQFFKCWFFFLFCLFAVKNMSTKYKHVCKFNKRCESLDRLYPPHLKSSKIKRAIREFFLISEKNGRKCFTPLGRSGYIAEKERQLKEKFFVIHPYSKFREVWEIITIIEICLGFFLRLLAVSDCSVFLWESLVYQIPSLFADLFETSDILMLFFVGFLDKETRKIEFNVRKIFFHRISNFFFYVNVIISIPLDFILYLHGCSVHDSLGLIMQNIVFLKFFKVFVCTKYLAHVGKIYNWRELMLVFIWAVLVNIFMCHWLTCIYHQITTYTSLSNTLKKKAKEDCNFFLKYIVVLHSMCRTLLDKNVALRRVSSFSFKDNFFWFFAINTIYFCSIINFGLIIHYAGLLRTSGIIYKETKKEIQKFLVHENLPRHIHKKVMKYFQFRYRNKYFVEEDILKALSPPLKQEVKNFLCMDLLVNNKSIFKDVPSDLATELCLIMSYEIFLPGDIFFRAGDKTSEMYFLYSGSVAVYSRLGKEVMHWYEGQQFGVSCFIPEVVHPVTVLALEMSECYVLRQKDFVRITTESPEIVKAVTKAAIDRRKYVLGLYSED